MWLRISENFRYGNYQEIFEIPDLFPIIWAILEIVVYVSILLYFIWTLLSTNTLKNNSLQFIFMPRICHIWSCWNINVLEYSFKTLGDPSYFWSEGHRYVGNIMVCRISTPEWLWITGVIFISFAVNRCFLVIICRLMPCPRALIIGSHVYLDFSLQSAWGELMGEPLSELLKTTALHTKN